MSAVGNDDVAYFGEVSNAEILSAEEFINQIPELFGAAVVNDNYPWLKFRYYGKYLFIKKYPIFRMTTGSYPTSWGGLYDAGLIYGVDGPGPFNYNANVNQLRMVKKGAYTFKVRTITGDTTETANGFSSNNSGQNDTGVRKSMFTELIYRMVGEKITGYEEKKFANVDLSSIVTINGHEITREIVKTGTGSGVVVARGTGYTSRPSVSTYTFMSSFTSLNQPWSWRPVLELMSGKELFPLTNQYLSVGGFMKGPVSNPQMTGSTDPDTLKMLIEYKIQSKNISYIGQPQHNVLGLGDINLARLIEPKIQTTNIRYVSNPRVTVTNPT